MCNNLLKNNPLFLDSVEKPSRYLGTEFNAIVKEPAKGQAHIALAFPDLYEIGTSHFGLQILYHLLNQQKHIYAERVYAPALDMEHQLRKNNAPLASLETGTALNQFDIIGFSLLYELNYTNVLNMIDLSLLPLFSKDRKDGHPFIIAGGPCVCNPEPMADFFDAMVFGDGEDVFLEMVQQWRIWKETGDNNRNVLLEQWAGLEGVYIPQFFNVSYNEDGFQHLEPKLKSHTVIHRRIVSNLDQAPFPDKPVVAFGRPIHDRLRLEISRGCTRGCRFCQAGMIYRPVRERSPETLLDICRSSLKTTGYEDLSLLSLSTGDYTCLSALMENLMTICQKDRVAVSLPSIRAGTLTPALMQLIRKVRKTGFTIAPEAGSQRLRDVINKNITYDDIANTVEDAFSLGWKVIKLYFMVGLPTETEEDVEAIVQLVNDLKRIKSGGGKRGRLNVSVTSFIPKPHTPFQWASQISMTHSKSIIDQLKNAFQRTSVHLKWQHPAMSILEGALARGNRRLSRVIYHAWKSRCLFDGWTDHFNFEKWMEAFSSAGVSIDEFTIRERTQDEPLPWQHMDARVSSKFLKQQWQAAQNEEGLSDCRHDRCHHCGACDFTTIQPQLFDTCPEAESISKSTTTTTINGSGKANDKKIIKELCYNKLDQARFFGHLELANIFARAMRRAGIDVAYSKGFHPMPRMSFDDPLPLGMESECEKFRIHLEKQFEDTQLKAILNEHLPIGLCIRSCRAYQKNAPAVEPVTDGYRINTNDVIIDQERLTEFLNQEQWPYLKKRSKGRTRQMDLRSAVKELDFYKPDVLQLTIHRNNRFAVRPSDVLISVFGLHPDQLSKIRVLKLAPVEMP